MHPVNTARPQYNSLMAIDDLASLRGLNGMQIQERQKHRQRRNYIVAYGGMGSKATLYYQTLITNTDYAPYIRCRFIEIDTGTAEEFNVDELIVLQAPMHDLITAMMKDPDAFPELRERLGNLNRLYQSLRGTNDDSTGAQQDREVGVTNAHHSIQHQRTSLEAKLIAPLHQLYRYNSQSCVAGNWTAGKHNFPQPLYQTHVSSICGGTGAGTILDMSYLNLHTTRDIRNYMSQAILMLPSAFPEVDDPQPLRANALATLKDLMVPYQKPMGPLNYGKGGGIVRREQPPFMIIYLIEGRNANDHRFESSDHVAQMVAYGMKLLTTGRIAAEYASMLKNKLPLMQFPYIGSSFGCAGLRFDGPELAKRFACRSGAALLDTSFLAKPSPNTFQAMHAEQLQPFIQRLSSLESLMTKNIQGRPISASGLEAYKEQPTGQMLSSVENFLHQQNHLWHQELSQVAEQAGAKLRSALWSQIERIINLPGGFELAGKFLGITNPEDSSSSGTSSVDTQDNHIELALASTLSAAIHQQQQDLTMRLDQVQKQLGKLRTQAVDYHQLDWFQRLFWSRKRFLKQKQQELRLLLEQAKLQALQRLFGELKNEVQSQATQFRHWRLAFRKLQEYLHTDEQLLQRHHEQTRAVVVKDVLCPSDEDELYEQQKVRALEDLAPRIALKWDTDRWILTYDTEEAHSTERQRLLSPEGIALHREFATQAWTRIAQMSVEDLLEQRHISPEEAVALLEERGAVNVRLNTVHEDPPLMSITLLDTSQGKKGFFHPVVNRSGLNVVQTDDPTQIVILSTIHGFSFEHLQEYVAMLEAYHRQREAGYRLHAFPEADADVVIVEE